MAGGGCGVAGESCAGVPGSKARAVTSPVMMQGVRMWQPYQTLVTRRSGGKEGWQALQPGGLAGMAVDGCERGGSEEE